MIKRLIFCHYQTKHGTISWLQHQLWNFIKTLWLGKVVITECAQWESLEGRERGRGNGEATLGAAARGKGNVTRLIINRDKPMKSFMDWIWLRATNWLLLTDFLGVSFIMFYLNMVNYSVFFLLLSTWAWNIFLTLRVTWGFYLKHLLLLRRSKSYIVGPHQYEKHYDAANSYDRWMLKFERRHLSKALNRLLSLYFGTITFVRTRDANSESSLQF